jgi:hypothetical protein
MYLYACSMMEEAGAQPDTRIFNNLLTICAKSCSRGVGGMADGEQILQDMKKRGLRMDRFTYHGLLDVLSRDSSVTNRMARARLLVAEMEADQSIGRDTVTGNLLLQCARADGDFEVAAQLFESLGKTRDSRSYTIMISMATSTAYAQSLLEKARSEGLQPTTHTYNAALEVAVQNNEMQTFWHLRSQMKSLRIRSNNLTKFYDRKVSEMPRSS